MPPVPSSKMKRKASFKQLCVCFDTIGKEIVRSAKEAENVVVLATGGLDSSLLAYLTKRLRPVLYFAQVSDVKQETYNAQSIRSCRALAKRYRLRFKAVPIAKGDYIRSFPRVVSLMDTPLDDMDLPAIYHFFKEIARREKRRSLLISGMGMDEIFGLQENGLAQFLAKKIPPELCIHQKIAALFHMHFQAPYIHRSLIRWSMDTPMVMKKNKELLREFLASRKLLSDGPIVVKPRHSGIPLSFARGLGITKAGDYGSFISACWQKLHAGS